MPMLPHQITILSDCSLVPEQYLPVAFVLHLIELDRIFLYQINQRDLVIPVPDLFVSPMLHPPLLMKNQRSQRQFLSKISETLGKSSRQIGAFFSNRNLIMLIN